jgi:2-methylcitrate dehydratase PrpD
MPTIAETFAEFAADTLSIPDRVRAAALRCVLDLMGCAVAGHATGAASSARRAAGRAWAGGPQPVWFSGMSLTAPGAAFCNSAMACQLDLDDGHRAAAGHPGAAVIPAAFACAGEAGQDALLRAIAVGYEVALRIASARDIRTIATTDSGQWCGTGASVAGGVLRGRGATELAHALAIGGTTAPGQWATPYTSFMGNSVKEGIPAATANGMLALDLAAEGFTGPIDIFDQEDRYDRHRLLAGLGETWMIEGVYFKPYSACRWCHAPVDAVLAILAQTGLRAAEIDHVRIETFGRALTLNNDPAPATLEAAQYSLPFCTALAATSGPGALLPMLDASLHNAEALHLAARVELAVDPELDAMFSAAVPARVTVTGGGRTVSHTVIAPKGEPSNPLDDAALIGKARVLWQSTGHAGLADRMERAFRSFAEGEPRPLLDLVAAPLPDLQPPRKIAAS